MPSSATITSTDLYDFQAGTLIRSAQVDSNFSVWRGHILPVSPSTSTAATSATYDLGASDHTWRGLFNSYSVMYGNTAGSIPSSPSSGYVALYFKNDNKLYKKTSAGTETEVGANVGIVTVGSRASPSTITAAGGIAFSTATGSRQMWFITGDTSTGTDISANPQIALGNAGDELYLVVPNTSTSNAVILEHGNGLDNNGYMELGAGKAAKFMCDGTQWLEMFRRE